MVTVTLTNCPPRLRGDLTKWLMEINTGVYVGNVNARIRELLWERICENISSGSATMTFPTDNEQRYDFYTYNSSWLPTDYEGIKLIKRPKKHIASQETSAVKSKAKIQEIIKKKSQIPTSADYVIIDIETTGLNPKKDKILEIAAIKIKDHIITETFQCLIDTNALPESITKLTGITEAEIREKGIPLKEGLLAFVDFIQKNKLLGYNINFDRSFINMACISADIPTLNNQCIDILNIARNTIDEDELENYQLSTVATYFGIKNNKNHRALADCLTTYEVYKSLQETLSEN